MMTSRPQQGGFSLTEMLVCMALMGLVVIAGWDLWDDAAHLMAAAGRAQHNPSFAPLSCQLRGDVHAATAVSDPSSTWSDGALSLRQGDGSTVSFERRDGLLWRIVEDRDGHRLRRRRLVDRVVEWRWREERPGQVDVQVGLSLFPGPERALGRRSSIPSPPPETVTRTLRLTLRRGHGGGQW